jgi:hypothetical protein
MWMGWALAGARAVGSQGVGCWYVWPHGSYSILAEGSVPQAGAAAAAAVPTRTYATVRMDEAVCVLRLSPPSPSSGSLTLNAAAAPVVHKAARLELPSQPPTRYAGARTTFTPTASATAAASATHVLMLVWRKFHQTDCTASVRVLLAPFAVDLRPALLQPPHLLPHPRPCKPSQPTLQPPAALLPHRCDLYAATTSCSSSSASAAASWVLHASPDPAKPLHDLHTLLLPPHLHDWLPLLTPGQWYLMPMMTSSDVDNAATALPPPAPRTASRRLTADAVADALLSSSSTTRIPLAPECAAMRLPCESPLLPLLAMSEEEATAGDDVATMTLTVGAAAGAAAVTVGCGGGEQPLRNLRKRVRAGTASWRGSGEGVRNVQTLLQWSAERHEPRCTTVSFTGVVLGEVSSMRGARVVTELTASPVPTAVNGNGNGSGADAGGGGGTGMAPPLPPPRMEEGHTTRLLIRDLQVRALHRHSTRMLSHFPSIRCTALLCALRVRLCGCDAQTCDTVELYMHSTYAADGAAASSGAAAAPLPVGLMRHAVVTVYDAVWNLSAKVRPFASYAEPRSLRCLHFPTLCVQSESSRSE